MKEKDREKFVKLINKRMTRLVILFHSISKLSNKTNYYYNEKDIQKIFLTIEKEVKQCKEHFTINFKKNSNFDIEKD